MVFKLAVTPSPPLKLFAQGRDGYVNLSWTRGIGNSTYNVYRGTTLGGEATTPYAVGIVGTSFKDVTVVNGQTYFYRINSINPNGSGPEGNEAKATPNAATAPPTGLAAQARNGQIILTWKATSGAASYNVYRGTASAGEGGTPLATGILNPTYTDRSVTNGTRYYYRVATMNAGGTSGQSAEATAIPVPPPPAVTGLTAVGGAGQITLHWTASAGATSYRVYRGTSPTGVTSNPVVATTTTITFQNTGRAPGVYYYVVLAVNAGGTSGSSAVAHATAN